ncbi:MAG: cupin domain-containing protein [Pseudonocardia sp.]
MSARVPTVPTADPHGPGVQQHALATVASAPTVHGDYAVHLGVTHLLPGAGTDELRHDVPEAVVVTAGALEMWVDGARCEIRAGDHLVIPARAWHRFANLTESGASMLFAFGGDPAPVTQRREPEPITAGELR